MRVGIIGGGINGFSCAVQILEHFKLAKKMPVEVSVISEAFSPNTTGDGSAGLWGPFLLNNTPTDKIYNWSKRMHDFLHELWLSEDAGEAGVCLIPMLRVNTNNNPIDDYWMDIPYGCQPATAEQLAALNVGRAEKNKFTVGLNFVSYISEPAKLLPYLMKRFQRNGGKILQQKVEKLPEFMSSSNYDVIINCTGLGSRELLKDERMYAVRGQVSRVRAKWMYYALLDDSDVGHYIIPNTETTVLGCTHQEHDYNTTISAEDKNFIVNGCRQILPGLEHAQHLYDWVGLRPGRTELRLEVEPAGSKILIHNYGHGGSGVCLSWGCAEDVVQLLEAELKKRNFTKSKL